MRSELFFTAWIVIALSATTVCSADDAFISLTGDRHVANVVFFAAISDNECLCSCEDKVIRQIKLDEKKVVKTYRFHRGVGQRGDITAFSFSGDRKQFVIGTFGEPGIAPAKIHIVDIQQQEITRSFDGHQKTIRGLRFINGGKQLVSSSDDKTLVIWDVATGKRLKTVSLSNQGRAIQLIHDSLAVVGLSGGNLSLVDLDAARVTKTVVAHNGKLRGLLVVGDEVISGGSDGQVIAWSKQLNRLRSNQFKTGATNYPVTSLSLTKDRKRIIYSLGLHDDVGDLIGPNQSRTTKAGLLNIASLQTTQELTGQKLPVRNLFQIGDRYVGLNEESDIVAWGTDGRLIGPIVELDIDYKYNARFSHSSSDQSLVVWASKFVPKRIDAMYTDSFSLSMLQREETPPSKLPPEVEPINKSIRTGDKKMRTNAWVAQGRSATAGAIPDYVGVFAGNAMQKAFFLQPYSRYGRNKKATFLDAQQVLFATDRGLFVFDVNREQLVKELFDQASFVTSISFPRGNPNWFMTNAKDNVLRFWNRNTHELVFSLFTAGNEWVMWTRDGYYDCSPGGERIVGWHVNRGEDKLAEFQPLQNFHKNFHSPKIIRRLWQTANVDSAFSGTQKPRLRAIDNLGPEVHLSVKGGKQEANYKQVRESEIELEISAAAEPGSLLTEIDLLINGRYVETIRRYSNARKQRDSFQYKHNLSPGLQDITVLAKATNQTFNTSTSTPVFYKSSSVRTASRKLFVLGIGISDYGQSQTFQRLPKASEQSKEVVRIMREGGSGLFDDGVEALSLQPRSRDEVFDAINSVKAKFKPTDMLVLYWAGHGLEVRQQFFFAMPGAEKTTIRQRGISAEDISKELADLSGGKVFLLIDTCEAGAALETLRDRVLQNGRADEFGIMTIAAAPRYQEAKDGLFGKVLIEGLLGTAATTYREPPLNKRIVMSQRLESFLRYEVRERSNKAQEPISNGFSDNRSYRLTYAK